MKRIRKKPNGFTMIELVVAVAIMGVLMIIAIPSVNYIQQKNKEAKFVAYEKSVTASSKLYTDQYSEDLFGSRNTGCAIIRYEDLKERDLVEDIQIKDTVCDNNRIKPSDYNNYTYVIVRKSKNGNLNYEPTVSCRTKSSQVLYGKPNNDDLKTSCKLEDGKGPEYNIRDTSGFGNPRYYYGEKPNMKVTISDSGVGLKEGQILKYQWFQIMDEYEVPIRAEQTIYFNNKNYEGSKTKTIPVPDEIASQKETSYFVLKVYGTLEDVDNNSTSVTYNKQFEMFIGTVYIKMNANGGVFAEEYDELYTINGYKNILYDGNDIIHSIPYNDSLDENGLLDYNDNSELNLIRPGYHIDKTKEWYGSVYGKNQIFNQAKQYKASNFCDAKRDYCYVTLYANWIINTYKLTYNNNGGTGCSYQNRTYGSKWGPLCTPKKKDYKFIGWSGVKADDIATKNITAKAQWQILGVTLTYNNNGGSGCTSKTVKKGDKWGGLCTPKKANNYFAGWYSGKTKITKDTKATSNLTVTAAWKPNAVTLTYDNNGGSGCTTKAVKKGNKWGTLCTPKRSGYKFVNWKHGKTIITKDTKATSDLTVKASWEEKSLKPKKPVIKNPSKGKWTNNNIELTVSTETDSKYLGYWYYSYDKKTLKTLKNSKDKDVSGDNKFKPKTYTKEINKTIYIRVCSIYADSAKDKNNCSDYANTNLRIDKTAPVMYTTNNEKKKKVFHYKPTKRPPVSKGVTITDVKCHAKASNDDSYKDDICKHWSWEYHKIPYSGGDFWWGWDNIDCRDAGGSGCDKEYWAWHHNSKQSGEWDKWNKKNGKTKAYDKRFFAGRDKPTWKHGWAKAKDKAGNESEVFEYELKVKYKSK